MKNLDDLVKSLEDSLLQFERGERGRPFKIAMREIRQRLDSKSKTERFKNK